MFFTWPACCFPKFEVNCCDRSQLTFPPVKNKTVKPSLKCQEKPILYRTIILNYVMGNRPQLSTNFVAKNARYCCEYEQDSRQFCTFSFLICEKIHFLINICMKNLIDLNHNLNKRFKSGSNLTI